MRRRKLKKKNRRRKVFMVKRRNILSVLLFNKKPYIKVYPDRDFGYTEGEPVRCDPKDIDWGRSKRMKK